MSKANVKALIDAIVKENHEGEITGTNLNEVLTAILNETGGGSEEDWNLSYIKHIASLYGATRDDATGLWTYTYKKCARWDSASNSIKWDAEIGYDNITDAQMTSMVDNRLLALSGTYGAGRILSSPIAFHFRGYGNNSNVNSSAYIYNSNIKTFGFIGSGADAFGSSFLGCNDSEIAGMINIQHFIGCVNPPTGWTLTTAHANLEYLTLRFNSNNQTHNLGTASKLRFECILYTIQDQPTRANCTLRLHPTLYDKIYNSSNPDYALWHKIEEANQARTSRVNILSA